MIKKHFLALALLWCLPAAAAVNFKIDWIDNGTICTKELSLQDGDDCAQFQQDDKVMLIVALDDTQEDCGIFRIIICQEECEVSKVKNDEMVVRHTFDVTLPWGISQAITCDHSSCAMSITASKIA